jgi:hypothetical protein
VIGLFDSVNCSRCLFDSVNCELDRNFRYCARMIGTFDSVNCEYDGMFDSGGCKLDWIVICRNLKCMMTDSVDRHFPDGLHDAGQKASMLIR